MNLENGIVTDARQVPSPNCDARPADGQINLLVIHGISLPPGEFGGPHIHELFTNNLDPGAHPYFAEINDLRVSSHLLIRRDGELVQFVNLNDRAWHAGVSRFDGRSACNDFSIGIELEGTDDLPYTDAQYDRLAETARAIMREWPAIERNRICGHSDIAPGRKTDPGPAFDWPRFRALLEECHAEMD
ncbi:MAG TPA: 1,6-anhydro-N-acetylmuramyl-L-alanine amidase AmpD [Gammaproteobacteria bacterium]|jgi:AmpD protein|nr:1,6-anhydro-N-acetylmuramyl-L-alanine amidase AmpD [Gammaproteobacteria bacterium]